MLFVSSRCTACLGIFPHWKEQAQETVCSTFLVEDLPATLAFLKLRVAELIEKVIGVNNKGFNSDLEENSAQLNADFYP